MEPSLLVVAVLAGLAAGFVNTVVGSGTLLSFPLLLAAGLPPLTANVSNTLGLVVGSAAGSYGYRRELSGQWHRLRALLPLAMLGSIAGALLLLVLPEAVFTSVVPVLIAAAAALVLLQPLLRRRAARTLPLDGPSPAPGRRRLPIWALVALTATGAYGGYFGAAIGVLLFGVLGALVPEPGQTINGLKNVVATAVNGIAAVVFVIAGREHIHVSVFLLIACGSAVGGLLGAAVGRRLPEVWLRTIVVLVGVAAALRLLIT